jgi:divalent metal cation (Fe/Co/Zn/Cd) transporter
METISLYIAYRNLRKTSTGESFFSSFRNSKNPAIFTVIAEDTAALTGVIIAFAGIALSSYFQNPIFDGSASILIGSVLIVAAISLAYETRGLLVGESADKEILEGIREIAKREMLVTAIDKPLTMYLGPDEVLVTMRVTFKKELSGPEIVKATNELKQKIMEKFPVIKIIYIETE